jgi:hypothetical protein
MLARMPAPGRSRRAALVALAVGVSLLASTPSAFAQAPAEVSLELIGQPVWHGPEDHLDLRLRVSNEGLSTLAGFRLQVRAYSHATSRSELHQNFEVDPLRFESSSLLVDRPELDVPAGTSTDVDIEAPVSGLTSVVGGSAGIYPVTITLTDVDGFTALDSVTTQLLYFPEEIEVPLNVALVWPLTDLPSRGAEGVFITEDDADVTPLGLAAAPDGWLTGILDALEAPYARDLRLGVAPGPRLVEELADMADADGYREDSGGSVRTVASNNPSAQAARGALGRLRDLVAEQRTQPIHIPYSFPDLTSVDDFEQLSAQLSSSRAILEDRLGISPDSGWLFAPGGRIDEVTLERLRTSDAAASTFFSADSLEPEPLELGGSCRQDFVGITYTCPVKIETLNGHRARGFVLDAELQQRFGALVSAPDDVQEMQKLFAELAQIWAELQGTSLRVIVLAVPPLWHPTPAMSARFVRTLSEGPWVRTRTPRGGLHLGIGAVPRDLIPEAAISRSHPDDTYLAAIDEAASVVESFARLRPPSDLVQRLRRDVLVGQSLLWSGEDPERIDRGAAFVADAQNEAEAELGKLEIAGRTQITLASRSGALPLSVLNSAEYPVSLEVRLESNDRDLELSETILDQTFEPGATPLTVQASARASGAYPVRVRLLASDGYEVFETSIIIRSTEFNEIALGITIGALVFLVLFSTVRGVRRRRASSESVGTG